MNAMHDAEFDLQLLRPLDALLREGSVTSAAHTLGITQSAMSHTLGRLRRFFDDPLFVRRGASMVPTQKALMLQRSVGNVMADVRHHIEAKSRFDPQRAHREFVFCTTDMGELVFLPTLLYRLHREAPNCRIRTLQVPTERIEALLASGDADLAIGSYRTMPDTLTKQPLFLHSFVTIVNASNASFKRRLTLAQFERAPQIVITLTAHGREAYDKGLDEIGVQRNVVLRTPHFLLVPLLLEQNPEFIATVPLHLGEVSSRLGMTRTLHPPVGLPSFAINQYWHPRFHHTAALVWMRKLIKQSFESYPDIRTTPS